MTMPNFGYHLARVRGNTLRRFYRALLPMILRKQLSLQHSIALEVFAYSGETALAEQVASIRSFLQQVGRPKSFTVVSDGSHSARSIRLLERIDPIVSVRLSIQQPRRGLPEKFLRYLATHPTGRQLALIMSLPTNGPALYVDSDVLFFASASDLAIRAAAHDAPAYYLADCQFSGDARLLRDPSERKEPVNTGVLLLFEKLDWSLSIQRFLELEGEPNFFTNQTMTHLTMHENGGRPFDPTKYVLQLDDQFVYPDQYAGASLVLRHYVNPVRHKFWISLKQ
jgi:hypothetical protein